MKTNRVLEKSMQIYFMKSSMNSSERDSYDSLSRGTDVCGTTNSTRVVTQSLRTPYDVGPMWF